MEKTPILIRLYRQVSLVTQIFIAFIAGTLLALFAPDIASDIAILGELFIRALKSVAPLLVLIMVAAAIANHQSSQKGNMHLLISLYIIGMFSASVLAVIVSYYFPSTLSIELSIKNSAITNTAGDIKTALRTLALSMIDNPFRAIIDGNYISLIVWGCGLGIALRHSQDTTKLMVHDMSLCLNWIVKIVIRLAPIGILGLSASTIAKVGIEGLWLYAHVLIVLVGCMTAVLLIINPLLSFIITRKNPYPLLLITIKESGIPAFFTRSSAANIPVNLELCRKLNIAEEQYSIGVPLGAMINMSGAAVTITVYTLATIHTLGNIDVDIYSALLLCAVASLCACGASGVTGGSLLLIPVACSLFGVSNDIAMQVVGIAMTLSVIQDSMETAVNSSTDVFFIASLAEANK